jgi:hypothetical protein
LEEGLPKGEQDLSDSRIKEMADFPNGSEHRQWNEAGLPCVSFANLGNFLLFLSSSFLSVDVNINSNNNFFL